MGSKLYFPRKLAWQEPRYYSAAYITLGLIHRPYGLTSKAQQRNIRQKSKERTGPQETSLSSFLANIPTVTPIKLLAWEEELEAADGDCQPPAKPVQSTSRDVDHVEKEGDENPVEH
ncbi:hypothetical protein M9H77_16412 [Catharanthus roseus]|uniref:Uncharacterized protein n=1 Tax=Catharanthus roseus TaxID=4058 RepID=A0ACC0B1P7_CATRO|nr:hypothetical protein M9H77_16412 [Catharanthus roseus]